MELQLLAEIANDIFGTGQVFSAGGNLTPPDGTAGGEEKGVAGARHAGASLVCVCACNCVTVLLRICLKDGLFFCSNSYFEEMKEHFSKADAENCFFMHWSILKFWSFLLQ